MTNQPVNAVRSEKGVALIIVLLLLTVMMGLTAGLSLSGQTEVAMAANELTYAGARAAAEAGLNRAIERVVANTTLDLLSGADGLVDAANAAAAVNADNGLIPIMGNGSFTIGTQYSYSVEILDDDDPSLYATALSAAQLTQMGEDGSAYVNANQRMILRATGFGPKGTTVSISRVLQSVTTGAIPPTNTTILSNPAILVGGNLDINGNITVGGSKGNVHANGNVTGGGSESISGDLTATGTVASGLHPVGLKAGGMPPVTIPEIKASDYLNLADWILTDTGTILRASDNVACGGKGPTCPSGWTYGSGTWSASGSMPSSATYYAKGNVTIHGTGKSSLTALSVIAEGSLTITGNGKFSPENSSKIQFVTNGDFELGGTVDADDSVDLDGQIMVREQMKIYGNSEFQGRVMVENRDGTANAWNASTNPNGRRGASTTTTNNLSGNMRVTYNGNLGNLVTNVSTPGSAATYTNNVSGWLEQ